MNEKLAIVVGATGLVGSHLCRELKSRGQPFRALVRSPMHQDSIPHKVVNFANDADLKSGLDGKTLFFCFGTTMKKAGSRQSFVDQEWGLGGKILKLAKDSGVESVVMVSSQGASSKSPLIYPRVKGQLEDLAQSLQFPSLAILRPSLLLGERKEDRLLEGLAARFLTPVIPWMKGALTLYRPIEARLVAQRMVELSDKKLPGCKIYENDQLHLME